MIIQLLIFIGVARISEHVEREKWKTEENMNGNYKKGLRFY